MSNPDSRNRAMVPVELLSVVIPAHNEEGSIESTLRDLITKLTDAGVRHEILVVNDNSRDTTEDVLFRLEREFPTLRHVTNAPPNGYGFAVRRGLAEYRGDAVAIYMADASDRPEDLIRFYETIVQSGADCVFGTRWHKNARVIDYPITKLWMNRLVNLGIMALFGMRYNDTTNAFKLFRRHVIEGAQPILAHHFNLTVELPLKAIVRGYTYEVVPNWWINRKTGVSKLKIKEMGSRYLFIILYCFIERWLSRGDYKRIQARDAPVEPSTVQSTSSQ